MTTGIDALTDKEKATLRLMVRGHDAKSIARHLGLSVHTINERLRDARRKLAVSSSREAARLLLEREGGGPERVGDTTIGDVRPVGPGDAGVASGPENGTGRAKPRNGAVAMSLALAVLALATVAQTSSSSSPGAPLATTSALRAEVEQAARAWLALLDEGRWGESFDATTESFKKLNTNRAWTEASERARVPLGAVRSRSLVSVESVPGPPAGYQVARFRTDFANRSGAVETVSLSREDGAWRIVGIYID